MVDQYKPTPTSASAALAYAKAGWHVFPLHPGGKDPLHKGGVNDATTDAARIRSWWGKNPMANIGIALAASGLGVIDLDVKPKKGVDGRETFSDIELLHGPIGPHAVQTTPSGGRHLVFARRADLLDRVAWEKGVDILTKSHRYIVAWPSRTSAGRYQWEDGLDPWDEVGELSPAWCALLRGADAGSARTAGAAKAQEGLDLLDVAALRVPDAGLDELKAILGVLKPECGRDEWLRVIWGAAAQWGGTADEDKARQAVEDWSASTTTAGQYKPGEVFERWAEHTMRPGGTTGGGLITWRGVRAMARAEGWTPTAMRGVDPAKWKDSLKYKIADGGGRVVAATPWNAALFLSYDKDFRGGVKFNQLTSAIEVHRPELLPLHDAKKAPWTWDAKSDWIEAGHAISAKVPGFGGPEATNAAIRAAAVVHAYDPMKQWIDGLVWDGEKRLDTWLHRVCRVADTALFSAMGRAWLIGLAARATAEADGRGVKMDSVLVLQGGEGQGKSSVGNIIGGEWFSDFSSSIDSDEAYYVIERSLVLEFAELDSMNRSEASRVKALVTAQVDTFRRKYDAQAQARPRRCVFLGTTNEAEFLTRDMTARRWWVVPCGNTPFDLRWLRANRDQLIAEARAAWDMGELPILPETLRESHKALVATVIAAHPYEDAMQAWTSGKAPGTVVSRTEAVEEVLGRTAASIGVSDLRKFNAIMPHLGWEAVKIKGVRGWKKGQNEVSSS